MCLEENLNRIKYRKGKESKSFNSINNIPNKPKPEQYRNNSRNHSKKQKRRSFANFSPNLQIQLKLQNLSQKQSKNNNNKPSKDKGELRKKYIICRSFLRPGKQMLNFWDFHIIYLILSESLLVSSL